MVLSVLKIKNERSANVTVPKLVVSNWLTFNPQRNQFEAYSTIAIVLHNLDNSRQHISKINVILPKLFFIEQPKIITKTLLDGQNPITASFTGIYKKSSLPNRLSFYDGVANVYVDSAATISISNNEDAKVQFVHVKFKNKLLPGNKIAVRFYSKTNNIYRIDKTSKKLFINTKIFDGHAMHRIERLYTKHFEKYDVGSLSIPLLQFINNNEDGGYDFFIHVPSAYDERKISEFQSPKGILNYDAVGTPTDSFSRRYAFDTKKYFNTIGHDFKINPESSYNEVDLEFNLPKDSIVNNQHININTLNNAGDLKIAQQISSQNTNIQSKVADIERIIAELFSTELDKSDKKKIQDELEGLRSAALENDKPKWDSRLSSISNTINNLATAGSKFHDLFNSILN